MVTPAGGAQRGRTTIGCLVLVILIAILIYVGNAVGQVYWRYYQYQDAFTQQARFAAHAADDSIIARLRAQADSLDLPPDAQRIHVRRTTTGISIWTQYTDSIDLPIVGRDVDFTVHAEKSF